MDDQEIDRRTLLQSAGGAAAASVLAGALSEAAAASDANGRAATEVPESARTVEGGLSLFAAKWNAVGGVIVNTQQFGAYLSGKTFNLYVADDGRAYRLELGPEGGASVAEGADPRAYASLTVDRSDWHDILYGEYTGLAPALEGRAFAPRSDVNEGALLAIILSVLAHIPVSTAQDLGSNAKQLRGIIRRRGETDCGSSVGDPSVETADERLERTATGTANRAPDVTRELATRSEALSYEDLLRGRSIEAVAAANVYDACRCNGRPQTLDDVTDPARVKQSRATNAYTTLNTELGLPAQPVTPSAFVPRLASELDVSDQIRQRARQLAEASESTGATTGVRPSGFAAACLYKAGREDGRWLTQSDVADVANVSVVTVRTHRDALDELAV